MAYKPSMRRHMTVEEIPLDIRPVMNLMVVLIPILLFSAEFVKLSIRELNLPPASGGAGLSEEQQKPQEQEKRLFLTVLISKKGFYIGTRGGYLSGEGESEDEPSIPLNEDGSYNYELLQQKLIELKEKIAGQGFADGKSAIISAEADIPYKDVVKVMDYITVFRNDEGLNQELFPQINIGQVI
jgi:biopolymer transport protein ExbD